MVHGNYFKTLHLTDPTFNPLKAGLVSTISDDSFVPGASHRHQPLSRSVFRILNGALMGPKIGSKIDTAEQTDIDNSTSA